MAVTSLVLIGVWLTVVVWLRGALQFRRTGGAEIRFRDPPGTTQWWAKIASSVGFLTLVAAPIAELAGLPPLSILDRAAIGGAGVGLVVLGAALTAAAQFAMGTAWRADVNPDAQTTLVTDGPFRWVRNPVLTGVATTFIGLALMTPNPVALAALAIILGGLQIQVRLVEEPYLLRVLGKDYAAYAARTGRFLPWLGRLR
ncbi:isoprenylcysteine carboxylmethyltransferase family protein [Nocardia sp. XZ_19_369]|uniref:methyltransferase family protein n=1 Tax=Nocardia sp. XZ_19_369 TaxID=2769487 RepID=UPI00188F72CB|nr:isoprenylcysteine carboxylmethyltransferase family protein [Nocardia sp. XZ_19_369]